MERAIKIPTAMLFAIVQIWPFVKIHLVRGTPAQIKVQNRPSAEVNNMALFNNKGEVER